MLSVQLAKHKVCMEQFENIGDFDYSRFPSAEHSRLGSDATAQEIGRKRLIALEKAPRTGDVLAGVPYACRLSEKSKGDTDILETFCHG